MVKIVGCIYKYKRNNIDCYFAYIGDSDDASTVIGGEIGLSDPSRKSIVISGLSMVGFVDKPIFVKTSDIMFPLMIRGKPFEIDKKTFNKMIKDICSSVIDDYKQSISASISNNFNKSNKSLINITVPEKVIRLLLWNQKKKSLKFDTPTLQMPTCNQYGVYFAFLGTNIGSEINKLRPVLIWKTHESTNNSLDNSYYVFPISSKIPSRDYYYNVKIMVNGKQNVIHVNDGKRISGLRIYKPLNDNTTGKMYVLSKVDREKVKEAIKKYFNT